ncbi:MAG: hypothetical protein V2I67_01430 [Thermoanaerobaculales bacterium]|jgi:photosystem II stability/assembly factor-like uncharacterized protein|nr:hypothetical protein [Thermoanaerobaculales bacterium]
MRRLAVALTIVALALPVCLIASEEADTIMTAKTFSGLKLRNIGPALMSGRIADLAIHPTDHSIWYVAVGSGGVWKTVNAGTTWTPIFDNENSYSIGCVTLDPANPDIVWVGTGENVGGRHVGFGDGIYRSDNGGATWTNMGLSETQHLSKIIVHPEDGDTVWVAAQGPLWSPGGERGLFKTTDGGATWTNVLSAGEWTGVTDLLIDPRDPNVLYAATWQHHRTIAAVIDGGPETGIHRSVDGGESWMKLTTGLPKGNMGKIGLAISPQNPDVLYAAIELDNRKGGVWRSADRGASWTKGADAVAGGTGPHYYQELYASPHVFDRIYLMDVWTQVSDDGGKSFSKLGSDDKHSDNHALAFRPDDPDWMLMGTDGGLYETFDNAATWRYVANLPLTQFYKLALDDTEPFYNVYGGTQDNNSQGGPVRTASTNGIRNADWFVTLFADGHGQATEPGNPDVHYAEWQEGNLVRTDRRTGNIVYIKPQPEPGDPPERFNWDAPILISPHSPTRVYFASQRVWRSDDRGDSWTPVSPDLTKDEDRMLLPVMDRQWSSTAAWDFGAMSVYNTITSLAESPVAEGVLWAGTDDGLIQLSSDDGSSWKAIPVGSLPGVPATAFVNDIKADLFDADTAYVALDNHKYGDFAPYLVKTTNRGQSWSVMTGDLPDRHLVWRLVQDHVNPKLFFAATEFGVFFTVDAGSRWVKLTGGVPTISFRDLAIQRRENDLVGASFGRGFFVLDDYTALREIDDNVLAGEATLFPVRKAPWYIPRRTLGQGGRASQGAAYYVAENPPFGAIFTYYLGDGLTTLKAARREAEKKLEKEWKDTPYVGYDALEAERRQPEPEILLTVRDAEGDVVRVVPGCAKKGFHRVAWDLRYPASRAIEWTKSPKDPWQPQGDSGHMAPPGSYTVTLAKRLDGVVTTLSDPVPFDVVRVFPGSLPGTPPVETAEYMARVAELERGVTAAAEAVAFSFQRLDRLENAIASSTVEPGTLDSELEALKQRLYDADSKLRGNRSEAAFNLPQTPSIGRRLRMAGTADGQTDYGPTATHRRSFEIAVEEWSVLQPELTQLIDVDIPAFEAKAEAAGVPWSPGRPLPE